MDESNRVNKHYVILTDCTIANIITHCWASICCDKKTIAHTATPITTQYLQMAAISVSAKGNHFNCCLQNGVYIPNYKQCHQFIHVARHPHTGEVSGFCGHFTFLLKTHKICIWKKQKMKWKWKQKLTSHSCSVSFHRPCQCQSVASFPGLPRFSFFGFHSV